jgi:EAL domain-containing protein (putative c-di-GMP-specific phosphodiesterase class I)
VVFEVTETDEADDIYALKALTDHCRNNGFRVVPDDVGSGYSSLNLLYRLRPDCNKLEMDLIRGVEQDPYKAAIARKILEFAHNLGIGTIAEGVETLGEMDWVRTDGSLQPCGSAAPPRQARTGTPSLPGSRVRSRRAPCTARRAS